MSFTCLSLAVLGLFVPASTEAASTTTNDNDKAINSSINQATTQPQHPRFGALPPGTMALSVLPSPDNFVGVALVINRSRDGPRFVFHYPSHVAAATQSLGAQADHGDDMDDDDDLAPRRNSRMASFEGSSSLAEHGADLGHWNHDDHLVTDSGSQIVPWERVAGFPTKDLENILTPARAYHKRLFQVSLDPLYCVSYPIYVPESGVWRKKKRQQQRNSGVKDDDGSAQVETDGAAKSGDKGVSGVPDADRLERRDPAKGAEEAEDKKSNMTMFNLVFFLHPNKHEVRDLVDAMFGHIIKKINKAYKYCQQRSDFVWKESKKILALKDKGREDSGVPFFCDARPFPRG